MSQLYVFFSTNRFIFYNPIFINDEALANQKRLKEARVYLVLFFSLLGSFGSSLMAFSHNFYQVAFKGQSTFVSLYLARTFFEGIGSGGGGHGNGVLRMHTILQET